VAAANGIRFQPVRRNCGCNNGMRTAIPGYVRPAYVRPQQPTFAGQPTLAPPQGSVELTSLPGGNTKPPATKPTVASTRTPLRDDQVAPATFVAAVVEDDAESTPANEAPSKYGYQSEYNWITGKLERSATSGEWKLRYIPIDGDTDQNGGSVLIANPELLDQFQPGDFVRLEGSMVAATNASGAHAPTYRIENVDAIGD
jgi:hypothetical protein